MTPAAQILVVDDDPEIRKLLARYVESQGFRVLLAASCRELHEQLATHQVDLVVLDVMLPDGSGLDACRDLRAARSNVPIILLTALKEDVDRIIGLDSGIPRIHRSGSCRTAGNRIPRGQGRYGYAGTVPLL